MKLLIILFVLICFISSGSFCLLQNKSAINGNISTGGDSLNFEVGSYNENLAFDEMGCHNVHCPGGFNCKCRNNPNSSTQECISPRWVCDGFADCADGEDEVDCHCSDDQFQCNPCESSTECDWFIILFNPYQCIPINQTNDGIIHCANGRDERISDLFAPVCINDSWNCNGYIECQYLDPHDEFNCSGCPSYWPIPCDCYNQETKCGGSGDGFVCYNESGRCDGIVDCIDGSDEIGCCHDHEFECQCFKTDLKKCSTIYGVSFNQCIPLSKYHDGNKDCPDGSDESQYKNTIQCNNCNVTMRRISHQVEGDEVDSRVESGSKESLTTPCEISTCHKVPSLNCTTDECNVTDMICASSHSCNRSQLCTNPFQCDDGSLLLANNFCDGKNDCPDFSDEVTSGQGFKCPGISGVCILSQHNLYDNISQCSDNSDLNCATDCFRCFDNRLLISLKQVCDGTFDCYDFSDECLCQINIGNGLCNSVFPTISSTINYCYDLTNDENITQKKRVSTINCETKTDKVPFLTTHIGFRYYNATLCDGRPECRDYSDECDCENPPAFCSDPCRGFYSMGDRYCDGIEDEAWKYINRPICPKGFDETNCPNRFMCKAGNYVSIDAIKICDKVIDCDEGEDEEGCTLFSSKEEMIANKGLKACFWIMSFVVIGGNFYVIMTSLVYFKTTKEKKGVKLQRLIVLNISIADIIMGIYLLIISIYSVAYSGFYGEVDHEWRSNLRCSIIGSFTILSSEASCLMLVLLATFRLQQVIDPFKNLTMWTKPWKAGIVLAWFISAIIAILPIFLDYFVQEIWISNIFMRSETWDKANITTFACRLAQLTNTTIKDNGRNWKSTKVFLENNFPGYAPKGEFGYYSETSICMPRFYASKRDKAWEYTMFIITLNFISFLYIAISYVCLIKRATNRPEELQNQARAKKDAKMQKRIARIILTDLICWIPICITSYVAVAGYDVPDEVYKYSAVLLLPINSALNPLLFSPLFEKVMKVLRKGKKDNVENIPMENIN